MNLWLNVKYFSFSFEPNGKNALLNRSIKERLHDGQYYFDKCWVGCALNRHVVTFIRNEYSYLLFVSNGNKRMAMMQYHCDIKRGNPYSFLKTENGDKRI